jgi:hypothetical protein
MTALIDQRSQQVSLIGSADLVLLEIWENLHPHDTQVTAHCLIGSAYALYGQRWCRGRPIRNRPPAQRWELADKRAGHVENLLPEVSEPPHPIPGVHGAVDPGVHASGGK